MQTLKVDFNGTEEQQLTNNVLRLCRDLGVISKDIYVDLMLGPKIYLPGFYANDFVDIADMGDWE